MCEVRTNYKRAYLEEGVSHDLDKARLSVAPKPVGWVFVQEALEDGSSLDGQ